MKELLSAALESSLHVCIVTFSEQFKLIEDLMASAFTKYNYKKILLRCNTKHWPRGEEGHGPLPQIAMMTLGKEQHLSWVVTQLYQTHGELIKPQEILLLDDDERNCRIAREFNHNSFVVTDSINLKEFADYAKQLDVDLAPPVTVSS
ncbi:DgyrCDS168 [Dimorphilus gyrociliatus]|nr:DgyrCDS168 [Dimorphilus gyrociliatus]